MIQVWFSDVVDGPWRDTIGGHHRWLWEPLHLRWPFRAWLYGKVNAFDMVQAVEDVDPDLVVSFGTWRNTHDARTLAAAGHDPNFNVSLEDAAPISGRQYRMFTGKEFTTCVMCAAQVQAPKSSFLWVAPKQYMDEMQSMRDRVEIIFDVDAKESVDSWYQGMHQLCEYKGWYFPKDNSSLPDLREDGQASVADIVIKHKRVLIISAGRCQFWAQVLKLARQKMLRRLLLRVALFTGTVAVMKVLWKKVKKVSSAAAFFAVMSAAAFIGSRFRKSHGVVPWGAKDHHFEHLKMYRQRIASCDRCGDEIGMCLRCLRRIKHFYGFSEPKQVRDNPTTSEPKQVLDKPTASEHKCASRLLCKQYAKFCVV